MADSDLDAPRSVSFNVARLVAQLQLLGSATVTVFSAAALVGQSLGKWNSAWLGGPTLVASLTGFTASAGFLLRRAWARAFLVGECALPPLAVIVWFASARGPLLHRDNVLAAALLCATSVGAAFAFSAREVRGWASK